MRRLASDLQPFCIAFVRVLGGDQVGFAWVRYAVDADAAREEFLLAVKREWPTATIVIESITAVDEGRK